jgi:hypothetical protein
MISPNLPINEPRGATPLAIAFQPLKIEQLPATHHICVLQKTHIAFLCHDAYVGPTVEAAMQNTQWHHASKDENFDTDATTPSGFLADRFGVRLSLLLLFVGLVMATAQVLSQPSFEKCSAIRPFADRIACYESLRNEYLKPPVK